MKVRPADPNAVIRYPNDLAKHRQLPVDGDEVPDNDVYWNRRLLAREVVRCDAPAEPDHPGAERLAAASGPSAPITPLVTR